MSPTKTLAEDFSTEDIVLDNYGSISISPIIHQPRAFNAIGIRSDTEVENLYVNFNPLNGGVWEEVDIHDDGLGDEALIFTQPTKAIQFRQMGYGQQLTLHADFIFASNETAETVNLYGGPEVASSNIKIIRRSSWGADEKLRYWTPETEELFKKSSSKDSADPCGDFSTKYASEARVSRTISTGPNGEQLIWPISYSSKVSKFVVHHTDSDLRDLNGDSRLDGNDYEAMVRAIYYYHSISRGWGDIGYNYIIDPLGNIYEGRYGGERAIGAHAQCYNNGSIGIAIIGNYEYKVVPEPALNSLISLIAQKAKIYGIDPEGDSIFRGSRMYNIIGHGNLRPTNCPGKRLAGILPRIRERASLLMRSSIFTESNLSTQTLDYNAEFVGTVPDVALLPNGRQKIKLKFKNTGRQSWDRNTWLHVSLNNKRNARVVPVIEDKPFVAADMSERSVSPGGIATFEVEFEGGYFSDNLDFEIAPVANGRYKISRSAVFVPVYIKDPDFSYLIYEKNLPSGKVFQGQKIQATLKLKNTGNVTWKNYGNSPIRLGTEDLRDRSSMLVRQHKTRIAHLLESEVKPGDVGTFVFNLEVPLRYEGNLRERFTPVIENVRWLEDKNLSFEIDVKKPTHAAKITSKTNVTSMMPGEMKKISITMQNHGDLPWDPDNMEITFLSRGIEIFKRSMTTSKTVKPYDSEDFSFWVQAPYQEGNHLVLLRPRMNRSSIRGGAARFLIDVPSPSLRARFVEQSTRVLNLNPGEEAELEVKFKNIGNVVWQNKGTNAIHLAPTRPQDRLSRLYYNMDWVNKYRAATMVEKEVEPGETGTFKFKIKPNQRGVFSEYFQLVIEQVGWIDSSFVRWDVRVSGDKVSTTTRPSTTVTRTGTTQTTSTSTTSTSTTSTSTTSTSTTSTSTTSTSIDTNKTYEVQNAEDQFRVKISYSDDNSKITADKNYKIYNESNDLLFSVGAWQVAELRRMSDNIHVQIGNITKTAKAVRFAPESGGIIKIPTMERRPAWNLNLNDNMFRGIMESRVVNGQMTYINELPLEDYLKGLAEVSNGDESEKQKVIAILARTYARFYMSDSNRKFPGMPYDGSDDPAIFQRYLGYGVETRSPNFASAVKATEDMVVTYNGSLVKTPYFNQSDGRTRSAQEVWGWTNTPYLQSVPDPYCNGLTMNGHGVGLSGKGAEGMAKAGKGYEEIIKYYYKGVVIEKLQL